MSSKQSKYSFQRPDCWKDEARMNALFAPFRDREVNEIFYDIKMKFWKDLIEETCSNVGYFTVNDLNNAFTVERRIPYCISKVTKDLLINGVIRTKEDFLASTPSQSWIKWGVQSVIKNPLWWSYGKLKQAIGYEQNDVEILDNKVYVHIPALKKKSESLLSKADDNDACGKVFAFEDLRQKLAKDDDPESFELSIHWLYLTGHAILMTDPNDLKRKLVKLAEPGDKVKDISQQELAIFALHFNENKLIKSIENLEAEKEKLISEARIYLQKKMQQSARNQLRKKQILEKQIEKQASTLENIQTLLHSVREAESNNKVVDAYRHGLSALKTSVNEGTADGVAATMDEVKDLLDTHDDIKESIGSTLSSVDEVELEEELAELLANNIPPPPTSTSPLSKLLEKLPSPPDDSPNRAILDQDKPETSNKRVRKLDGL